MSGTFANSKIRHGTASGYRKHQELGEWPCDACSRAKQSYDKEWRSAPERVKKSRRSAAAQRVAIRELTRRHRDEYRKLYLQARADQEAELSEGNMTA